MLDYTGVKCPVCHAPFGKDDDIVVCPECGAPYHRECYQKEGKCIFDELHAQGKEWAPPLSPQAPGTTSEIKDQECPVCGCLNAHSARFCNRCGTSLPAAGTDSGPRGAGHAPTPPVNSPYGPSRQNGAYSGPVPPFVFDPMGGVSPAEILDAGVTFGDASKLVKQNTGYYMPVFRYIKQTGRNKFNFSAFLFSGAWLLYRKQYKWGCVVTALMFCIYLTYLAVSLFVSTPVLLDLMKQVGMDVTQGFAPTNEQMLALTELMAKDPLLYFQIALPMLCLMVMLAVMIVVGVRGNKMYLRHCIETVRTVKRVGPGDDPGMTLDEKGGVNVSLAICMFVCYFLLVNVVPLII